MTNKINRNNATNNATKGQTVSSVQMHAKVLAPSGEKELAKAVAKTVKASPALKAVKTVATKTLPVADNAALEIRLNALASMLRGLNERIDDLSDRVNDCVSIDLYADDIASIRDSVSALSAPASDVPAHVAASDNGPFETAANAAIANYHAGYVNERIVEAATKMGKAINARCYLRTNENKALKAAGKAMNLSLSEIEAALDALVFDA